MEYELDGFLSLETSKKRGKASAQRKRMQGGHDRYYQTNVLNVENVALQSQEKAGQPWVWYWGSDEAEHLKITRFPDLTLSFIAWYTFLPYT